MPFSLGVPSGYVKIAIENGPVEIVDLPINSMVIFHSYVNVYQRVSNKLSDTPSYDIKLVIHCATVLPPPLLYSPTISQ